MNGEIKKKHIEAIKSVASIYLGNDVNIYLFSSRVDDTKKGGDIDLYLETKVKEDILRKKIKMLGERKLIL